MAKMLKKSKSKSSDSSPDNEVDDIENDHDRVQQAINKLRHLVSEEKNLEVRTTDKFMLRYLRWSEFDPEKAFEKMTKVYKFKAKHEDYYCKDSPLAYNEFLIQNVFTLLEDRDQHGRRVFIADLRKLDINNTTIKETMMLLDLWMELVMEEEETQKNGVVIVADVAGFPLRMFRFFTPRATIMIALKEEARPWGSLEIHVINSSTLMNTMVSIVFPFLSARFQEQIHFHGKGIGSLHEFVAPEILPQEYGGHKATINYEKMRQYLYDNETNVHELCLLGYKKENK